jgi:hypothetical protein
MAGVSENDGLLNAKEYHAFKERSIGVKFMWQMFAALGGSTFFALLTAVGGKLLAAPASANLLGLAGGMIFSPVGLAFIAIGAASVYMAQRYYFQSTVLDQDFQAKKIAAATGKGKESPETQVAVAIESEATKGQVKSSNTPINSASRDEAIADTLETAPESKWADKFTAAKSGRDEQRAPGLAEAEKPGQEWKEKVGAAEVAGFAEKAAADKAAAPAAIAH